MSCTIDSLFCRPPDRQLLFQYLECPEQNCEKKFRSGNGLKFHQSSAHPPLPPPVDPANFEDADDAAAAARDRHHRDHHRHRDRHHAKEARGATPNKDAAKFAARAAVAVPMAPVVTAAVATPSPAVITVVKTEPLAAPVIPVATVTPTVQPVAVISKPLLPPTVASSVPPPPNTLTPIPMKTEAVTLASPVAGVKHAAPTVADHLDKHKKPKLDKPGTVVRVRGTASIAPMKTIAPGPRAAPIPGTNYQPVTTPAAQVTRGRMKD